VVGEGAEEREMGEGAIEGGKAAECGGGVAVDVRGRNKEADAAPVE
jgi:hypothetical protein